MCLRTWSRREPGPHSVALCVLRFCTRDNLPDCSMPHVERSSMVSKVLTRILTLTIPLLFATLVSTAQAPNVPPGRFHHSGAYDESRKQFLIYGGFTWDQGPKRVGDVWGWDGSKWR